MPYFIVGTTGSGVDAEENAIRPVVSLYQSAWSATANMPGTMLVRCEHVPAFDSDGRIQPLSKAGLLAFAPDEGEADDWESPELAAKVTRRMLLLQKLGINDPGTTLTAKLARAQLDKIKLALASLGYKTDLLTNNMLVGDMLLATLPQIGVRIDPGAVSRGGTFTDNFNGEASNVDLAAHTPSGGTAWTRIDGVDGMAQVSSTSDRLINNTSSSTGALYQCDDQGNVDQYVQYICENNSISAFICNRATNRSNFIGVRTLTADTQIYKNDGGSFTQLGTTVNTAAAGETIRMESSGDAHEAFEGGVSVLGPLNDAFNNTETRQGVCARISGTAGWADDFEAGTLGGGTTDAAFDFDAAAAVTWNGGSTRAAAFDADAVALVEWNGALTAAAILDADAAALVEWVGDAITPAAEVEAAFDIDAAAAVTWNGESTATAALDADATALAEWEGTDGNEAAPVAAAFDMDAAATFTSRGFKLKLPQIPFTDNFNGETENINLPEHEPSGGAEWVMIGTNPVASHAIVTANELLRNNTSADPGTFFACDDQGSINQYIQYVVESQNITPFVVNRCTNASNFLGIRAFNSRIEFFRRQAGTFSSLGNSVAAPQLGDVIMLASIGDVHRVYLNGTLVIGPVTDSFNNTETRQGVIGRNNGAEDWLDNFEAGPLEFTDSAFDIDAVALLIAPGADAGTPADDDIATTWGVRIDYQKAAMRRQQLQLPELIQQLNENWLKANGYY